MKTLRAIEVSMSAQPPSDFSMLTMLRPAQELKTRLRGSRRTIGANRIYRFTRVFIFARRAAKAAEAQSLTISAVVSFLGMNDRLIPHFFER